MKKKLPVVLHQLSNFSSGLGNSIVMITIPWLILEETGSPAFSIDNVAHEVKAIDHLIASLNDSDLGKKTKFTANIQNIKAGN